MLFVQIGDEPGEVRERLRIDGERAVLKLVVDVEVEDVGGNPVGAETVGDLARLRFRRVGVARLLKAESPQRRERRRPGEIGVAFYDLLGSGAIEDVVVKRSAFRTEGD